jgi:hypothetical protein
MSLKELRNAELRGQFGSFLAETLLADHFLRRDLRVSKGWAANGPNADLEVVGAEFSATVEVYSPQSWKAREDWVQDVVDTLKNADVPFEYAASVTVDTGAIPMTPGLFDDAILRTGRAVLDRLETDLKSIDEASAGATRAYTHEGGAIRTTIKFTQVSRNRDGLVRAITMSPPGEVFQAEELFDDILHKIRDKAGRRQALRGAGAVRGLAVDASRTGIDYEVETGRIALDPATSGLDLDELDLDFVALTVPWRGKHGPARGVRASLLFENTRITRQQLAKLFDLPPA